MDTQNRIIAVLRKVVDKPIDTSPEDSLFESGVLDSFALADLVTALEQEFSLRIPDSDATPRKFDSIARIQSYLQSRS